MHRGYADGETQERGEAGGDRAGRSSPRAEPAEGVASGIVGCEIRQLTQGTSTGMEH